MKKLLLGLGSIAAIAAPIAAVVSCGDDKPNSTPKTPEQKLLQQMVVKLLLQQLKPVEL